MCCRSRFLYSKTLLIRSLVRSHSFSLTDNMMLIAKRPLEVEVSYSSKIVFQLQLWASRMD